MKILAIICEFNPFHNGHKYLIEKAKDTTNCDAVLCIMSGSFTQRGEVCILDKYTRAKHAILGGADCVIQLPAVFTVAPAEIFAKGAIKILSSIPDVTTVTFGCENGTVKDFTSSARILVDESSKFKAALNDKLAMGESYIKSYAYAFNACGGDTRLISSPNSILGLEYTKAIIKTNSAIGILPIKRIGAGYNDPELKDNYSSASAIRQNLKCDTVKNSLPDFVYDDLKEPINVCEFESLSRHCLFKTAVNDLRRIYGCAEGLENKLKSLENLPFNEIIEKATTKRYASSRIKRILCANTLKLYRDDCEKFLNANLYIKPLAVKKRYADLILTALSKSAYPVITGAYCNGLETTARECFEKDSYEFSVFNHVNCTQIKDYMIIV